MGDGGGRDGKKFSDKNCSLMIFCVKKNLHEDKKPLKKHNLTKNSMKTKFS